MVRYSQARCSRTVAWKQSVTTCNDKLMGGKSATHSQQWNKPWEKLYQIAPEQQYIKKKSLLSKAILMTTSLLYRIRDKFRGCVVLLWRKKLVRILQNYQFSGRAKEKRTKTNRQPANQPSQLSALAGTTGPSTSLILVVFCAHHVYPPSNSKHTLRNALMHIYTHLERRRDEEKQREKNKLAQPA